MQKQETNVETSINNNNAERTKRSEMQTTKSCTGREIKAMKQARMRIDEWTMMMKTNKIE